MGGGDPRGRNRSSVIYFRPLKPPAEAAAQAVRQE